MKRFSYVLTHQDALEGRNASHLTREAARFSSRISLSDGVKNVLLSEAHELHEMGTNAGSRITVFVEGKDEEAAVAAMQNYFVQRM